LAVGYADERDSRTIGREETWGICFADNEQNKIATQPLAEPLACRLFASGRMGRAANRE
jgi:hypothetical protein